MSDAAPAYVTGDPALDIVTRHLASGEHVEWTGQPDPKKYFARGDLYLVPFSLLWGGFSIFWEYEALKSGGGFFALWGIPFVALGLYMIFGRFIYKAWRKRRTVYAVTDKRVMTIVSTRRGEQVNAMYLSAIPTISTTVDASGRGSVEFGPTATWQSGYGNSGMEFFGRSGASAGLGFYDVEDPKTVADLIERLRDQPAGA